MKSTIQYHFILAVIAAVGVLVFPALVTADPFPGEAYREAFENGVAEAAERYIDMPLSMEGKEPPCGVLDNSHLFNLIYHEAAEKAGLSYLGYAPMRQLLDRTVEVPRDAIRVGDLLLLKDGLAAMICKMQDTERFRLIYVSNSRKRVVSFSTRNVVWDAYWLKNLDGYRRLNRYNFSLP